MALQSRHAIPVQQARSQLSLNKLIAAAEHVLGRDGWQAFTMNAVAAEAGVSIGGIYRRFASKEDLLRAIKDNVLARADDTQRVIVETSRAKDLDGALAHYVHNRIASLRDYSGVMRQIFEGQNRDPVMEERGRKSVNVGMRTFRSVLSPFRNEINHRDPELAIETAFFVMNATFMRRVRTPSSDLSFDHIDWSVLEAELLAMLALYLKAPPQTRARQPRK
jgi:AcrR family transcriptional regulator